MTRTLVLIIDDSRDFTEFMSAGLSSEYTVITATDALDGYALLCQRKPDVVVLDVLMPVVDGWTVLRKVRSNPAVSSIPVVIVTGLQSEAAHHEASRLGVTQVLLKPVSPAQLGKAIKATEQK